MTIYTQNCVLASNNQGKLREINAILAPLHIKLIPQQQFDFAEAEETGLSFIENAILKARQAAKFSGLPAIADDSGLQVFALQGEPGIYSARYADPHALTNTDDHENLQKVLRNLANNNDRKARFVCAIAMVLHADDPTPQIFQGFWDGEISHSPSGSHGFGYDPIFYLPEHHCSSAELEPKIKNAISHRAQALQELKHFLENEPHYFDCVISA